MKKEYKRQQHHNTLSDENNQLVRLVSSKGMENIFLVLFVAPSISYRVYFFQMLLCFHHVLVVHALCFSSGQRRHNRANQSANNNAYNTKRQQEFKRLCDHVLLLFSSPNPASTVLPVDSCNRHTRTYQIAHASH
jgi:hypothetical protein